MSIPRGKYSWKTLNWENQYHSLTMFYWVVLNENVKLSKDVVDNCKNMFESRISAGAVEKLSETRFSGKLMRTLFLRCPMIWKVMLRSAWEDILSWRVKQRNNYTKSHRHALMTTNLQKNRISWRIVNSLLTKCSEMCILGSYWETWYFMVREQICSCGHKWNKACDKRVARLISYIHHTCVFRQYCYVGNTAQQCRLGFFQDSDFAGDLEDSKSTSGGILCFVGSHTFVPISWMCKKQTSVWHSSTEAEITSLDAGSRHGWNFRSWSLGLSDWSISFLTQPSKQCQRSCRVTGKRVAEHNAQHAKRNSNQTHQSRSD